MTAWVRARALELGLVGSATNLDDGRVQVDAEGPREACDRLLAMLSGSSTDGRPGTVTGVLERWSAPRGVGHTDGFVER